MNIENIVKNKMCCGCGTCAGICPLEAIEMKINKHGFYAPIINKEKCNQCGICDKVCPQINKKANINKLNKFVFGKVRDDKLIGNYINCYVGYSTDENIRFEASSGGMISQILISALEEGIIGGALVTRMKKDDPLIPEPFIARTKEEIISAMCSKYCPVPSNIVLKEIIKSKTDEKFAVVGLPCHIAGIRKAEIMYPKLEEKIILHLGLFCGGTASYFGTKYILSRIGIEIANIKSIKYRGKGWPGYMQIKLKGNIEKYIPFSSWLYYGGVFGILFTHKTCIFCKDHLSMLSDISFGDAWDIEKEDTKGTSVIIVRTKFGDELIKNLSLSDKIKIIRIKEQLLLQSRQPIRQYYLKNIVKFFLSFFSTYNRKNIREFFIHCFSFFMKIFRKIY